MSFNFAENFACRVNLDSVVLDGKIYRIHSIYMSPLEATIYSIENDYIILDTVRYIGGVPWKAVGTRIEHGKFKSFLLGYGFKNTYLVSWGQIHRPEITNGAFVKMCAERMIAQL